METEQIVVPFKKKTKNLYSMVFFLLVVLLTWSLFWYNYVLKGSIDSMKNEINKKEMSILDINKDENISIFNLVNTNKLVLEKMRQRSDITAFISHVKKIENKYKLNISWFNYNGWILTSGVSLVNTTESLAYDLANKFISLYREDKSNPFDLWFIWSVKWNDNLKFSIELKLKD